MQPEAKGSGCSSLVVAFLVRVSVRTAHPPGLAGGQNPLRPCSILSPLQQAKMSPLLVRRLCFVIKVTGGLTCGAVRSIDAAAIRRERLVLGSKASYALRKGAEICVISSSCRASAFQGFAIPVKRVGALLGL